MKGINTQYTSIEQLTEQYLKQPGVIPAGKKTGASFQEILEQTRRPEIPEERELKFSKHAVNRLSDRSIELSGEQLDRLSEGTKKAEAKGINESLVLVDDIAFIVNVRNNTVVTAMDQSETKENVFTNIDGAVII